MIQQPIPIFSGLPGKLEASAELRNLLAQGYLPLAVGGQSILLVNTPRSFRGGLAFVFDSLGTSMNLLRSCRRMQCASKLSWRVMIAGSRCVRREAPRPRSISDIAPIIYKNCSTATGPGKRPVFAAAYAGRREKGEGDCRGNASRYMPPWKAEPASFAYRDERRLNDREIDLIRRWVKAGMPEGDPQDAPASEVQLRLATREPDMIVEMPAAYHVPADGPDIYRNIAISAGSDRRQMDYGDRY